jgi:hypothetical protein
MTTFQIGPKSNAMFQEVPIFEFGPTSAADFDPQKFGGSLAPEECKRKVNNVDLWRKRQTPRKASRRLRPAFRLPTRLAVGFGLEALEAFGLVHPGRWQAVALVPPFLGAED